MPGQPPDVGPAWDLRASMPPLAAVLDPVGNALKNELLNYIQMRPMLRAVGKVAGCKVMDFGSGTGRLCTSLVQRGAWVVGVDASEPMAAAGARAVPGARFVVADSGECFSHRSLDLVTTVTVLQYYRAGEELNQAVRVLAELLAPKGRLIMLEQVRAHGLQRGATQAEYIAALESAGLRLIRTRHVRRSDSKILALGVRYPRTKRLLPPLSALEAKVTRRPLTSGRYAEFVFVAEAA